MVKGTVADQMQGEARHTALEFLGPPHISSSAFHTVSQLFVKPKAEYTLFTVPNRRQRTCADVAHLDRPGEIVHAIKSLLPLSGPGVFQ